MSVAPLNEAQRDLAAANLSLVPWVITRKLRRSHDDPEWDDLYQDGCIGLIDAARRFDPERGFTFSTYAVRTIWGNVINGSRDRNGTGRRPRIRADSLDFEIADGLTLEEISPDPSPPFDDRVADRDLLGRVFAAFDDHPRQRGTLAGIASGLSKAELARRHGVSSQAIRFREAVVVDRLRRLQIKDSE